MSLFINCNFCFSTSGTGNVIETFSASSGNYTLSGHREKVTNLIWVSSNGEIPPDSIKNNSNPTNAIVGTITD